MVVWSDPVLDRRIDEGSVVVCDVMGPRRTFPAFWVPATESDGRGAGFQTKEETLAGLISSYGKLVLPSETLVKLNRPWNAARSSCGARRTRPRQLSFPARCLSRLGSLLSFVG